MGKRIIQQARGKGSLTYRVRKSAFSHKVGYPLHEGAAKVVKLFHSPAHYAPLLKVVIADEVFYTVAFDGALEGQEIVIGSSDIKEGNIVSLKDIPLATKIHNIERNPGDGGKMIRSSGSSAFVNKKYEDGKIGVVMPNKKEIRFAPDCRATIGVVAGDGRKTKPFVKAGKKYYKMKARSKLWPRVSAVAVNAIDHPFGSGRGKNVGSKVAKRNAPAGRKVGHLRPARTGRKKR